MAEWAQFRLFTFPQAAIVRVIDQKKAPTGAPHFSIYGLVPPTTHPVKLRTQAVWSPGREMLAAEPVLSLPATLWHGYLPYPYYGDFRFTVNEFRIHEGVLQSRLPCLPNMNYDGTLCFGQGGSKPDLGAAYHSFWNCPFFCEFSCGTEHPRGFRSRSYFLPDPKHTCPPSDDLEVPGVTCNCLEIWFREVVTPWLANYPTVNNRSWNKAPALQALHIAPVPDAHLLFKIPKPSLTDEGQAFIQAEWIIRVEEGPEIYYQSLEDGERYLLDNERSRLLKPISGNVESSPPPPPPLAPATKVITSSTGPIATMVATSSTTIATATVATTLPSRVATTANLRNRREKQRGASQEKTQINVRRRPPKKIR